MKKRFGFKILKQDVRTAARIGEITTPHGIIATPAYIPVGTQATVKSLTPNELSTLGVQMFFVNTYHMYLRPGIATLKKLGGLHKFMAWGGPVITDSGGFQVFSLARTHTHNSAGSALVKITEKGVEFRSHWDGTKHLFTPETSMQWQWDMGSDIHIAFDDCTPYGVTHKQTQASLLRTHRWAARSLEAHKKLSKKKVPYQALYGVVQGGVFEDLRALSAKFISELGFDGIAIGGVSVGESKGEMAAVLDWVVPHLPNALPRHLLGVGEIDDVFAAVERGIDTFDCVQPTRLARTGRLLLFDVKKGHELDITKALFARDARPIDPACACSTCAQFSRGYLHHLFRVRELLAYRLATVHNVFVVQTLLAAIRKAIVSGTFLELKRKWAYNT
jgi:tRNA-guanine transglycosylase